MTSTLVTPPKTSGYSSRIRPLNENFSHLVTDESLFGDALFIDADSSVKMIFEGKRSQDYDQIHEDEIHQKTDNELNLIQKTTDFFRNKGIQVTNYGYLSATPKYKNSLGELRYTFFIELADTETDREKLKALAEDLRQLAENDKARSTPARY